MELTVLVVKISNILGMVAMIGVFVEIGKKITGTEFCEILFIKIKNNNNEKTTLYATCLN